MLHVEEYACLNGAVVTELLRRAENDHLVSGETAFPAHTNMNIKMHAHTRSQQKIGPI